MFSFLIFFEHKMSKLVIKEIQEKQGILKKNTSTQQV